MSAVVSPAELRVPDSISIGNIKNDIDAAINAATGVLDFVTKYGSFIPVVSGFLPVLADLDKILKTVKSFIDAT